MSPIDDADDSVFEGPGPGPHPLIGRQTLLVQALRGLGVAAWVLALAGLLLPGDIGSVAAGALVALLVIAPVARVAWLCARWIRRGDPRYALLAGLLVVIALSGGAIALV
jgi:hypothetical protein